MKLRTAPALDGIQWARSGWQLVRRQAMAQMAMVTLMTAGLILVSLLPWVGTQLALVLVPALNAGWVFSSATVQAGGRTSFARLLAPLAPARRPAMVQLGLYYMVACMLVLWLGQLVLPGLDNLPEMPVTPPDPSDPGAAAAAQAASMAAMADMLARYALLIPVNLLFWHAPVIVHRIGGSAARALFASALASWRNLSAFAVYGAAWAVSAVLLVATMLLISAAIREPAVIGLVAFLVAPFFSAAFYASMHASVHGCIEFDEIARAAAQAAAAAPAPAPDPDA
ncbi:MAG: hypothetical protein RLZZ584_4048 [Pseudomonadota bacterium]|jgi:hypothetical protein